MKSDTHKTTAAKPAAKSTQKPTSARSVPDEAKTAEEKAAARGEPLTQAEAYPILGGDKLDDKANGGHDTGSPSYPALGGEEDAEPTVRGTRMVDDGRAVKEGDKVLLVTPNPIDGRTENMATVLSIRPEGKINVRVDGQPIPYHDYSGVLNHPNDERQPYWRWPEGDTKAA